ncbi:hypothetical protein [Acetobacter sp. AAB5]|uniref:hypothetical protein n=1 Tax=Acetobacter sp. AAB5 TaxID=3418370 RepID=UPI003CF01C0A
MAMNVLFNMALGATAALLPSVPAILRVNTGYKTAADGTTTPCTMDIAVTIRVQPVPTDELTQTDGQNQSTIQREIYMPGTICGVDRTHQFGGDVFVFDNAHWLVTAQPEAWGGQWCRVLVTQQVAA